MHPLFTRNIARQSRGRETLSMHETVIVETPVGAGLDLSNRWRLIRNAFRFERFGGSGGPQLQLTAGSTKVNNAPKGVRP
jgi:hypothetical protein